MDARFIEKRRQLSNGETGVHWALSKRKKGYSTISAELRQLLIVAFNDHPHVIGVSPNAKDTLQVKNEAMPKKRPRTRTRTRTMGRANQAMRAMNSAVRMLLFINLGAC